MIYKNNQIQVNTKASHYFECFQNGNIKISIRLLNRTVPLANFHININYFVKM